MRAEVEKLRRSMSGALIGAHREVTGLPRGQLPADCKWGKLSLGRAGGGERELRAVVSGTQPASLLIAGDCASWA